MTRPDVVSEAPSVWLYDWSKGEAPLHTAALHAQTEMIKAMIAAGFNINRSAVFIQSVPQ